MADNTTLNSGSGGDTIASDDISGVKHQRVKVQYGDDGSATDVSDTNPLPIDDAGGSLTVDNADITTIAGAVSGTEMQVDVVAALPAGTNSIGKIDGGEVENAAVASNPVLVAGRYDNTPRTLGDGDAGAINLSANGSVNIYHNNPLQTGSNTIGGVIQRSDISGGGLSVYRDEDIDETAVALSASQGQIYWIHCVNLDATPVYLHFYNVAQGSVTVGTTAEVCSFCVPSQGDANGAGFTMNFSPGISFDTAITVACTTTIGGTAGPGANEVILNVGYAN